MFSIEQIRNTFVAILFMCVSTTSGALPMDEFGEDEGSGGSSSGNQEYTCADCRDPFANYVDFGNYAHNLLLGEDPSVGLFAGFGAGAQTWFLDIKNSLGEIVSVSVEVFDMNVGIWPDETREIMVVLPNGVVLRYNVLASGFGSNLPVGVQQPVVPDSPSGSSDGAGGGDDGSDDDYSGEEDDSFDEAQDYLDDDDGPEGVVEIEDPNEDGEFGPWDEEEEL